MMTGGKRGKSWGVGGKERRTAAVRSRGERKRDSDLSPSGGKEGRSSSGVTKKRKEIRKVNLGGGEESSSILVGISFLGEGGGIGKDTSSARGEVGLCRRKLLPEKEGGRLSLPFVVGVAGGERPRMTRYSKGEETLFTLSLQGKGEKGKGEKESLNSPAREGRGRVTQEIVEWDSRISKEKEGRAFFGLGGEWWNLTSHLK